MTAGLTVAEPLPLTGLGVLVTRPAHQAEGLRERLAALGAVPILFPVLAIADPLDTTSLSGLASRLEAQDLGIFISPNAVTRAMTWINQAGGWPPSLPIATVGKGSARELARYGLSPAICPSGRFDSEALLAHPALAQVTGQRIIIFRGEGGREWLAEELTRRGAQVEYATVYRRVCPSTDSHAQQELLGRWVRGEVSVVTVTSSEGLRNLYDLLPPLGRLWLRDTPLLVVSERTQALAKELGWRQEIRVATQASDEAMVKELLDGWPQRRATSSPD